MSTTPKPQLRNVTPLRLAYALGHNVNCSGAHVLSFDMSR
jgi:hypothetical protein